MFEDIVGTLREASVGFGLIALVVGIMAAGITYGMVGMTVVRFALSLILSVAARVLERRGR